MAAKANGSTSAESAPASAESAPASKAHVSALAESAYLAKVMEVVPNVRKLIRECKAKDAQPTVDEICRLCLEADLAYRKNILGRHCGIHPENRAKTGVDPFNAQMLALKISLQGYSESKLENPMGFEPGIPGTAAASVQEKFMKRNFELANDLLRPVHFQDTEYLPVTCSHTMAALNLIEAGDTCMGLHEDISTNGRIDQQKALKLCPSWRKPMRDGVPCLVFRRELEEACPELAGFLSQSSDTAGTCIFTDA